NTKKKIKANKDVQKLVDTISKLEKEKEEMLGNAIFKDAFEWRFEFPEILNNEGDFMGFDLIIGNPPYFSLEKSEIDYFNLTIPFKVIEKRSDIYTLFYELGLN